MAISSSSTVVKLPRKVHRPRASRQPKRSSRRVQLWVAGGGVAVIATLLFLSLSHLADGIRLVTRCASWEAISLAVGIDVGLVIAEAALLVAGARAFAAIQRYAMAMIGGTLVVSAALNALAFANGAEGWMLSASIAFGIFIPVAVFVLTKIAAGLAAR